MLITPDLLKKLSLDTFIAFDVETTGLDPDTADIIQFSASKFVKGELEETFHFFCNPGYAIPEHISELTRITDDMVAEEAPFSERVKEVYDYFGEVPLVGHNVKFDLGFLRKYSADPILNPILDTLELSRIFLYYLTDRKLETLASHFALQTEGAHRANVDTENTGHLLLKLLEVMLQYDYPVFKQINSVIAPLVNEPNHSLFEQFLSYYESQGRIEKEKLDIKHSIPINQYGKFKKTPPAFSDSDSEGKLNRVNSKVIQEIFGYKGKLENSLPHYEMRLGQIQMASEISEAFNKGKILVAEAGTGVGKSLAYLIPAIKWVQKNRENGYTAVISSNTKALQEQLFFKDIPFIYEHIDKDFKAVLLKGRNNYICLTKWENLIKNIDSQVSLFERTGILPLIVWLRETKTGDIEENSGFRSYFNTTIWSKVASEPGYCTTKKCNHNNGCYLGKIRNLAKDADIIVVNHSLLLSNAAADNQILPEFPILIIDEAHNLEKSAYRYFAKEVGAWTIDQVAESIFHSGRGNFGTLVNLNRKIGKGTSWKKDNETMLINRLTHLEEHIRQVQSTALNFFKEFLEYYNVKSRKTFQKYVAKIRYVPDHHPFKDLAYTEKLFEAFDACDGEFDTFLEEIKSLGADESAAIKTELDDVKQSINTFRELKQDIQFLLQPEDESFVYWFEVPVDIKNHKIKITATPLDVSGELYEKIIENKHSVVATSATLSVGEDFSYFLGRSGFAKIGNDRLIAAQFESPFDFEKQSSVWILTFLPEPNKPNFDSEVAALMNELASRYRKGTLLLTTSYQSIMNLRKGMDTTYKKHNIPLISQSGAASRTALIQRFKNSGNATLIGTESFWEGVDVPGSALEILAMLKLPFAVPSEPVVSAISENFKKMGQNGFLEYSVPEAVLKFKQGFGRLIRSKEDRGIALFFDNRLSFKRYGQSFINSLPSKPHFVKSKEELFKNLDFWYKKEKMEKRNHRR